MKIWHWVVIVTVVFFSLIYLLRQNAMDAVIRFIIKRNEGGFQDDPNDPGNYVNGKLVGTKYGISAKSYPNEDIRNLTLARAVEIYKRDYLSKLPTITNLNLLYQVLDMAINAGPGTAVKLLKPGMDSEAYKVARLEYYQKLKGWNTYSKSWSRRVNVNYLTDSKNA